MPATRTWVQTVARAGYFSRGVVYAIISVFALLASLGAGSSTGSRGALHTLLSQPFGTVLVALLVAGLMGFVVWRTLQSVGDADNHGMDPRGIVVRLALATSAVTYATLAVYALGLLGLPTHGDGKISFDAFGALADLVGSRHMATGLSLLFLGIAIGHWWKVLSGKYARHFDEHDTPMRLVHTVSALGLTARGAVFALLSAMMWFGVASADSASEVPSTEDALRYVQQLPLGQVLLFALALGLMIFAVYSFVESRWRRVSMP